MGVAFKLPVLARTVCVERTGGKWSPIIFGKFSTLTIPRRKLKFHEQSKATILRFYDFLPNNVGRLCSQRWQKDV